MFKISKLLLKRTNSYLPIKLSVKNSNQASLQNLKRNHIIVKEINRKGILQLNHPENLNCLTRSMLQRMFKTLRKWEQTKDLVILRPFDNQNLCVGGDLRNFYQETKMGNQNYGRIFMSLLYSLCYMLGSYKIPYLSIMNGPTMGSGLGISVHGKYRIVTDKTIIAMPEPRVGMFTDVGSSYFLPRLKGKLGFFLALSSYRLNGNDALHAGIATHYVPVNELESVYEKLINLQVSEIGQFLDENYKNIKNDFTLAPLNLSLINDCFSYNDLNDIINSLNENRCTWAKQIVENIKLCSPTALKITYAALKKGSNMSLEDCVKMEYRLICNYLSKDCDFMEGIRSMLVDKDHKPKWNPSKIEEVSDEDIEKLFSPILGGFELQTQNRELLFM